MNTKESVNDFLGRMREEADERKKAYEVETIKFPIELNNLYRIRILDAWGKTDADKGDFMGFRFDVESPVTQDFENKDGNNTFYLSGISLRNFRGRVLRSLENNDKFQPIMVHWDKENNAPVNVMVPKIPEEGINVQFVQVDSDEGKRYKQIFGEVVAEFPEEWETADAFVSRMHDEYEKWRENRKQGEGGEKLKIIEDVLYECKLVSAFGQKSKDGSPGEFIAFNVESDTLDYVGKGDTKSDFFLMGGYTLRTFNRDVLRLGKGGLAAKEGDVQIQVGFNKETKEIVYTPIPNIPTEGVWVRFVRVQPDGKQYKIIRGEMFTPE